MGKSPNENQPEDHRPILELQDEIVQEIETATTLDALENVRTSLFGRKGRITALMKELTQLDVVSRKERGILLNNFKDILFRAIDTKRKTLEKTAILQKIATEYVDISLPPRPDYQLGRLHPISQTITDVIAIFADMGFRVVSGPDIETEYYNFTALNIPPEHPARQMHDTFYLPDRPDGQKQVLRTHTSPVQIHTMQRERPPIQIIAPGRTYRCDYDMTHTPMFHQVEGLVVDESTHMGHLKGCIIEFCRTFFQLQKLQVRFRPSFFPFTEPSAEVDIGCSWSKGSLEIGTDDDWLEIMGCGMIHPKVLANCQIDPHCYQGFAFGMGIERIAMLKYGITDLRAFFEGDWRWHKHYGFLPLDNELIQ